MEQGIDALCPVRDTSCLDWSLRHQAALEHLREANSVRLQRWSDLLALRQWQVRTRPALDEPFADASVATLWCSLLALDLARALERDDDVALEAALARAAEAVAFWRRVQQGPQELVSLLVAAVQIETLQRIGHDVFMHVPSTRRAALAPAIRAVLQPPLAAIDWSGVTRRQQAMIESAIRESTPGLVGGLRRCFDGSTDQCLTELAMSASIARQDTANHHAELLLAQQRWLEAEPAEVEAAAREFERTLEQGSVPFDRAGALLAYFAFNPAGKILSSIAVPAFPYDARLDDFEATRRLLLLALLVEREEVAPADLADFLESQPPGLRAPVGGAAFGYDPTWHELTHTPSDAAYFKRAVLRVPLPAPLPLAAPCERPLRIDVTEFDDPTEPVVRFVSCGNQVPAGEDPEAMDPEHPVPALGLIRIRHRREGELLALRAHRVATRGAVTYRDFEGSLLLSEAEPQTWLSAQGAGDDATLHVRVAPHVGEPWISLQAKAAALPELAQAVADTAGLQLRGVELLAPGTLTQRGDLPLQHALEIIADAGGVVLTRAGNEVRFTRAKR